MAENLLGMRPSINLLPVDGSPSLLAYEPSRFERMRYGLGDVLSRMGLSNYRAHRFANQLLGQSGVDETGATRSFGAADLLPFAATPGAVEDYRNATGLLGTGLAAAGVGLSMVPGGGAAKKGLDAAGDAARGIINTIDLRKLDVPEAIQVARSEQHLMQDKSGQYIGAPRGVKTPVDIAAMRQKFDAQVEAGIEGADWYPRARTFNEEIAGPVVPGLDRPQAQSLAAAEQALFSAQATPDTNMGFALQAHNHYEAGRPMDKVRTGAQARNYNTARDENRLPNLGPKTAIYGGHLDNLVPEPTTGTNDIWHARGFGYTNADGKTFSRALSAQEHRFLDYETMLAVARARDRNLGGRSDWTAGEIQAAPWVAGKGAAEAERRGIPLEEGVAIAAKTYPDYGPKYTAYSTSEQIPGKSTGLLGDLIDAPYAQKQAFTDRANWIDETGRDPMYGELGMYSRRSDQGPGFYINSKGVGESNPVTVGKPLVSYRTDEMEGGLLNISQVDERALDAVEAVRGLIDFQEGAAWNKIITHATSGKDRAGFAIDIGRMPTADELAQVNKIVSAKGYGMGNTENGVALLDFEERSGTAAEKAMKSMEPQLRQVFPDVPWTPSTVLRGRQASGYIDQASDLAKEKAGSGRATRRMIANLVRLRRVAPDYYEKLLNSKSVSKKARANLDRLEEFGGKGQRKDYEEFLEVLGEGGLNALLARIKKLGFQGLPAIGGVALGSSLLQTEGSNDPM